MLTWLDRAYVWVFSHGRAIAGMLFAGVLVWTLFGPTICTFDRNRVKVSWAMSDLRAVRTALLATSSTLETAIPTDVFASSRRYSLVILEDHRLLFSVGPDGISQHGQLLYDVTNGTLSAGDLVTTLPLK